MSHPAGPVLARRLNRRPFAASVRAARSRAFTLLEVSVAAAIGLVMLGVLYSLFHTSTVVSRKVESKSEAIQSATLGLEAIKRDLKQLVTLPLKTDATGKITGEGLAGDHRHPVVVSANQKQISFYIPAGGADSRDANGNLKADTVNYRLLPASGAPAGTYLLARTLGSKATDPEEAGAVVIGARNVGAVYLRDIEFKLLDPNATDEAHKSPDANYYLQVKLDATDSQGKETLARVDLNPLDDPSRQAAVPALQISEAHAYVPLYPLVLHVNTPSLTPPEIAALDKLHQAATDYEKDPKNKIKPLEQTVQEVINELNQGPGTKNVLVNPNNQAITPGPVQALPVTPGQPVAVAVPGGVLQIPSSPAQPVGPPPAAPSGPSAPQAPAAPPASPSSTPSPSAGNPGQPNNGNGDHNYWATFTKSSESWTLGPDGKKIITSSGNSNGAMNGGGAVSGPNGTIDMSKVSDDDNSKVTNFLAQNGFTPDGKLKSQ